MSALRLLYGFSLNFPEISILSEKVQLPSVDTRYHISKVPSS